MVNRKRIARAKISFVSLCRRGANRVPGLYKSEDNGLVFEALSKMDEKGQLLSIVYAPDVVDAQGHFATREGIIDMAHSHAREGSRLDLNHNGRALSKEDAYVAETFIVQANDRRFDGLKDTQGRTVPTEGAWATITQINNPDLRKLYREQDWQGVSLYAAPGDYELVDEHTPLAASAAMELHSRKNGTQDMDETKLAEALAKALATNNTIMVDALSKAINPPKDPKDEEIASLKKQLEGLTKSDDTKDTDDEAPTLPSDVTDQEAMAKYQRELGVFELKKKHDLKTVAGLAKFNEALAKMDDIEVGSPNYPSVGGSLGDNNRQEIDGLAKSDDDEINAAINELGFSVDPQSQYGRNLTAQR